MIQNLLAVMSCRNIDGVKYIMADISFECYSSTHVKYIFALCIPGLLIWSTVIPFLILRKMIQNKNRLDSAYMRLKYGFLY